MRDVGEDQWANMEAEALRDDGYYPDGSPRDE